MSRAQHPALRGRKWKCDRAEWRAGRRVPPGVAYEHVAQQLEAEAAEFEEAAEMEEFARCELARIADDPGEVPAHRESARRHLVRVMNAPASPHRREAWHRRRWAEHFRREAHAARRFEARWRDGPPDGE